MRKKVFIVLGILVVFRVLAHVPIPLAEPTQLKIIIENLINSEGTPEFLQFLNTFSGGALTNLSIMLAGLGPYINASIIMQLMARAIPKLEKMKEDGEYGQKKINQYTRILTLPIAVVQSIGLLFIVRQAANQLSGLGDITANAGLGQWALMVGAMTAGSMVLMWLGELITEQGIGNGISILITVGIVSQIPFILTSLGSAIVEEGSSYSIFGFFSLPINSQALTIGALLLLSTFVMTLFVVYLNEAQRQIKISYAKRTQGNRTYSDVQTVLPVKLITAGVIPIIFAAAFLSVPQFAGQLLQDSSNLGLANLGDNLIRWFPTPGSDPSGRVFVDFYSYIYPVTYFILVVVFTFFYTSIVFNSKQLSERMQRQGGFIEGVRPGEETRKYLSSVVNRLNLIGAVSLGFLALTPILAQHLLLTDSLSLAGTSILILVAVSLETLRQVESKALMITYEDYDRSYTIDKPSEKEESAKNRWFKRARVKDK